MSPSLPLSQINTVSDKGDVFGWGNSEYNQLAMVTDHTQINIPQHLPLTSCGRVVKAVAGGSICAVLNGKCVCVGLEVCGKDESCMQGCARVPDQNGIARLYSMLEMYQSGPELSYCSVRWQKICFSISSWNRHSMLERKRDVIFSLCRMS